MVGRRAHGQLKTTVLALLREAEGPVTARMLLERWPDAEPRPAFTTVITVLTRLQQAGAIERIDGAEARFRVRPVAGGVAGGLPLAGNTSKISDPITQKFTARFDELVKADTLTFYPDYPVPGFLDFIQSNMGAMSNGNETSAQYLAKLQSFYDDGRKTVKGS